MRLMAPGPGGCRNVKWIRHISVSEWPSELGSGSKLDSWTSHREHCAEDTVAPDWKSPLKTGAGDKTTIVLDHSAESYLLPTKSCRDCMGWREH